MKSLESMSLEELWELFPIILRDYNPDYPGWYSEKETCLKTSLKNFAIRRINHIGSTAVTNLKAKPIIDILLELDAGYDMEGLLQVLMENGWILMWRKDKEGTMQVIKGYTPAGFAEKVYHLHIRPLGDWDELYFRDYLRINTEAARTYEQLKLELKDRYEHNRDAYTDAKHDFVTQTTVTARRLFGSRYLP